MVVSARWFCVSRKGGTGEEGDMHILAAVAVCRNDLVGTGYVVQFLPCLHKYKYYKRASSYVNISGWLLMYRT